MRARPLTVKQANALIVQLHRHHKPVRGHRFSVGAEKNGQLVGAVVVGRPVARQVNQYAVAEVTRLVTDGTKNACTFLYASAARAAEAMGFDKIQTYILDTELGTSLRAAGWEKEADTDGGDWNRKGRAGRRHGPANASEAALGEAAQLTQTGTRGAPLVSGAPHREALNGSKRRSGRPAPHRLRAGAVLGRAR